MKLKEGDEIKLIQDWRGIPFKRGTRFKKGNYKIIKIGDTLGIITSQAKSFIPAHFLEGRERGIKWEIVD